MKAQSQNLILLWYSFTDFFIIFSIKTQPSLNLKKNSTKLNHKRDMDRAMRVVALVFLLIGLSEAQSICNMSINDLYACRPSATPPNPPPPSAQCCMALSHADLHCFCTYRNSRALPSFGVDPNLAMQLPKLCRLPNSPNC